MLGVVRLQQAICKSAAQKRPFRYARPQYSRGKHEDQGRRSYSQASSSPPPSGSGGSSTASPLWLIAVGVVGITAGTAVLLERKEVDYVQLKKDIEALLDSNPNYDDGSYGPLFVRLAWHASGTYDKVSKTGGSNGATMRFPPESDHGANKGLHIARKLLEPLKTKYGDGLSYADLWTFAGAVAIEHLHGPKIPWRPGRTDAVDASTVPPDGRLPDASQGAAHIRDIFYRMGFSDREIVALIGAHTLGRCHTDRSGFTGPWTRAPTMMSNSYYQELLGQKWRKKKWTGPEQFEDTATGELMMLPGDMAFLLDPEFKKYVEIYASDEDVFFRDFSVAFSKLLELGVPFNQTPAKPWWQFW